MLLVHLYKKATMKFTRFFQVVTINKSREIGVSLNHSITK